MCLLLSLPGPRSYSQWRSKTCHLPLSVPPSHTHTLTHTHTHTHIYFKLLHQRNRRAGLHTVQESQKQGDSSPHRPTFLLWLRSLHNTSECGCCGCVLTVSTDTLYLQLSPSAAVWMWSTSIFSIFIDVCSYEFQSCHCIIFFTRQAIIKGTSCLDLLSGSIVFICMVYLKPRYMYVCLKLL